MMNQPAYPVAQPIPQPNQQAGTSAVSPEVVQAILALQQQQSAQKQTDRQLQQAQAMRQRAQQPLQATSPGGGRVGAPNWAGALANVYGQYKAGEMDRDSNVRQSNMDVQRMDALRRYFQALTGRDQLQQQSLSTPSYPGEEGE